MKKVNEIIEFVNAAEAAAWAQLRSYYARYGRNDDENVRRPRAEFCAISKLSRLLNEDQTVTDENIGRKIWIVMDDYYNEYEKFEYLFGEKDSLTLAAFTRWSTIDDIMTELHI